MTFPQLSKKHRLPSILTAEAMIAYRRRLGRLPRMEPPHGVLLCLHRGLPERLRRQARYRKAGRLVGDLYLLRRWQGRVAVVTDFGIGAPVVAGLAEELIALGARRLVSLAWGGALQPDLRPGDVVVCRAAVRDEGTSHHYLPSGPTVAADPLMVERLAAALERRGITPQTGTTWTTDAPYRETAEEVRSLQAKGVLTVEMEAAALFALGQVRGVSTAALVVVGDSLAEFRWEAPTDVAAVERGLETAYLAALEALAEDATMPDRNSKS